MERFVVLLRGINVSASTRIAMADLRDLLGEAGFAEVRTHLQSGNVLVRATGKPEAVAEKVSAAIAKRLEMEIDVVVRTAAELRRVIRTDPFGTIATDGSKYFVTFFSEPHDPEAVSRMVASIADTDERVHAAGREVYLWCPDGIRNSALAKATMGKQPAGLVATVRNWNTVTRLMTMVDDPS